MTADLMKFSTPYRCAIYFAPKVGGAWWTAGSEWLGRCAATNGVLEQPQLAGVPRSLQRNLTAEPRRYGWHATLKAPFRIGLEHNLEDVVLRVRDIAAHHQAFDMPELRPDTRGGFLALRPVGDHARINALAASCVRELHSFAAPLSELDLARRRKSNLTPEQNQLLMAWGYPYVMEQFRFHLSLTGALGAVSPELQQAWVKGAQVHFQQLPICRFDRISIFVEPTSGADFQFFQAIPLCRST